MERYIGLDVHSQTCSFVVVDQKGREVRSDVVETNGKVLVEYLRLVPGRKHLCMEEGTQSQWLAEIMAPHVEELAVIWPERKQGNKNDELDARGLAEQIRTGSLGRRTFKAPKEFCRLRQLAHCYRMVNNDVVRTKNRIRSMYRSRGVFTGGSRFRAGTKLPYGLDNPGLDVLYEHLQNQVRIKDLARQLLIKQASKHKEMKILITAPGFGPVRAALLLAEVVTPYRFRTSRQFWSYCGFGIVRHSSADWVMNKNGEWVRAPVVKVRGLNRNYNRAVKNLFKAAATTVVTQMYSDPLFLRYKHLLESGKKPNLAKLTISRKLAATVLAMWKRKERYHPEKYQRET